MSSRRTWTLVLLLLVLAIPAAGQSESDAPLAEVTLIDGTVVRGRIVSEADSYLVIESDALGRMQIERNRIRSITYDVESQPSSTGWRTDPDTNSLVLVPTAETQPKGDMYYRNFLLLFNNFGYAVSNSVNLSVMAAFPVTSDLRIASVGAKFRLLSRDQDRIGLAASVSTWFVDDEQASTLSGIVSLGDRRRSVTAALNYGFADGDGEVFFLLGGDLQVGSGFKLVAEYGNSESAITDEEDFKGIINVGFRLFWEQTSFTLTGFRPLEETGDDFVAFPLTVFSAHF